MVLAPLSTSILVPSSALVLVFGFKGSRSRFNLCSRSAVMVSSYLLSRAAELASLAMRSSSVSGFFEISNGLIFEIFADVLGSSPVMNHEYLIKKIQTQHSSLAFKMSHLLTVPVSSQYLPPDPPISFVSSAHSEDSPADPQEPDLQV